MATKQEIKRKAALDAATELFSGMTQEQANAYFAENISITQMTKAHMAAYIKKYATKKTDKDWIKNEFYKASHKTEPKKVSTLVVDANGNTVYKRDKKTNKAKPAIKRVDSSTGEIIERFSLSGARKEFINHFGITPKSNKFTVKDKRSEEVFDEFADIF